MCRTGGILFDIILVMSLAGVRFLRHWPLVTGRTNPVFCHGDRTLVFDPDSRPFASLKFLT